MSDVLNGRGRSRSNTTCRTNRAPLIMRATSSSNENIAYNAEYTYNRRSLLKTTSSAVIGVVITNRVDSVDAISAKEASKSYDSYAENYEALDGGSAASLLGIEEARINLLEKAAGSTLEVGVGTGLNISKYNYAAISKLTLLDVSEGMLSKARSRANEIVPSEVSIDYVIADATSELIERFGEAQFDTVVDTFSLCVMGNAGAVKCLQQLKGVVKSKNDGGACDTAVLALQLAHKDCAYNCI